MVTGDLAVDGNVTTPLKFAQTFHLMPNGASWYIHNDIFRLNYGARHTNAPRAWCAFPFTLVWDCCAG